jgi:hypothetical protein
MSKKVAGETTLEARRMVDALMRWGIKGEEIAYRLRLSLNTIIRWRKARAVPQPGHLDALRALYDEELKRRPTEPKAKRSAVAA